MIRKLFPVLCVFAVLAILFAQGCATVGSGPMVEDQAVYHLLGPDGVTVLDSVMLPPGFEELSQDETTRGWLPIAQIEKPNDCEMPGIIVILGSASLDGTHQFNMLLHVDEDPLKIKILALSMIDFSDDSKVTPIYWFGSDHTGKLVSRDEFDEAFGEYFKRGLKV